MATSSRVCSPTRDIAATTPRPITSSGSSSLARSRDDTRIKRELRHRAGVEPVIGHLKEERRKSRNYLALSPWRRSKRYPGRRRLQLPTRLIQWLRFLLRLFLKAFFPTVRLNPA